VFLTKTPKRGALYVKIKQIYINNRLSVLSQEVFFFLFFVFFPSSTLPYLFSVSKFFFFYSSSTKQQGKSKSNSILYSGWQLLNNKPKCLNAAFKVFFVASSTFNTQFFFFLHGLRLNRSFITNCFFEIQFFFPTCQSSLGLIFFCVHDAVKKKVWISPFGVQGWSTESKRLLFVFSCGLHFFFCFLFNVFPNQIFGLILI